MENYQDVTVLDSVNLKNKVDYLESQLVDFQQVIKERDLLLGEVGELKQNIQELIEGKEKLQEEHAEELAVLSSSFSQHFENGNDSEDKIQEYEREIQKLRNCIEDKSYHINQLQKKLMKTQVEMENDLEKHEAELENLRSQLEKLENSDTESLVGERMNELKANYETEIQLLKEKLQAEEETHRESTKDEQLSKSLKEIEELKVKLRTLEDGMEDRLEEEETKFRREVLAVKDKLIHQHQLEIDELLSQLERSNAEVDKLRRLSKQGDSNSINRNQPVPNGNISGNNVGSSAWNGLQTEIGDSDSFKLIPVQIDVQDTKTYEQLDHIHALYQQQADFIFKRMKDQFQEELEDNSNKFEEDHEQQLERQRAEYEEKIVGVQRQLRTQHQADLDRATNDMEDQIQVLKNGHTEELAEFMQRLRGLSDERRRSYIEQDNTQQHVIVIKEEFKSKVESLEQDLRVERQKVSDYEEKLQGVETQVQAFKTEKEQEVKYIEEELKKQCKLLVEKKAKELKERYQSELNEKVNKVEKTLSKQYDEDSVRTRSELEESHRTLKEKYDNEITDIMTQMEQVQQRNQEVFEAEQKEQFEKQLFLVMEELEPYKGKCQELEKENKNLSDKYNRDLSELKVKMDEVEKRYSGNEKIEQESLRNLGDELNLYKTKVKELEEGNQMLVLNYGAQMENMKRQFKEGEEGELKTLQEEVTVYTKKVENLQQENISISESYENQIQTLNNLVEKMRKDVEEKESAVAKGQSQREELNKIVDELSQQLESYINNCAELEETKKALDNRHAEEIEKLNEKIRLLDKDLEYYRSHCNELEHTNTLMESDEKDDMIQKIRNLETELDELRKTSSKSRDQRKNSEHDFVEIERLTERIQELEQELLQSNDFHDNEIAMKKSHLVEVQTLREKITDLDNGVQQFRDNCNRLQEVKKSIEDKHVVEKQDLISQIERQTVLVGEREKDLQVAVNDKEQVEVNLKKVSELLQNSNSKFEVFKTDNEALVAKQTTQIDELTHEIQKLNEGRPNQENPELSEENKRLKTEHNYLEVDLDNLRAENEQLLNESKDAADRHKKEADKLNEEILSLREQETKQSKNLDKVQERYELLIVDLKEEIGIQKGSISELERTNSQYVQEIASLLAEVERLQLVSKTTHNDSISSEESFTLKQEDTSSSVDNLQKYKDEIAELKAETEQSKSLIQELEDEGDNKFGVLLSQHEKELEVLKEELEEQIARKREQLAKEAAAKRQKLKEEYEAKLRVIFDELVTERSRSKDQIQQINQLSQKIKLLEGINTKQKKDIERVKQMEDKLKELERQSKKKESDVETKEDDYRVNIQILEEKLEKLLDKVLRTEKDLSNKSLELNESRDKIKGLQEELAIKVDENDKPHQSQLKNLIPKDETESKVESQRDGYLDNQSEEIESLKDKIKELEVAKAKEEEQSHEADLRMEKLQKDLQNMDRARQAVVQMYDEKIEAIGVELDDAVERGDVLSKQLNDTKKMLRLQKKEMEEKQRMVSTFENELKTEKDTVTNLKQKINELEEQLVSEKERAKKTENEEEVCQKLALLTTDLQNEKESNSNLKLKIEEQHNEIESREQKLVEIKDVVTVKDQVINEGENRFKVVQEELIIEKERSSNLEKELDIIKDSKNSDVLQSIEQMKRELHEQHQKTNERLKESYESLLSKKEGENRIKSDKFHFEIVTLKGMVENLEQLNLLKDEDKEIQLKELEERNEATMREYFESFEHEKNDLDRKLMEATTAESARSSKVDELALHIQTLTEEHSTLNKSYENEIKTLKKQLDFESSFQVELQEGFQSELKENMEQQAQEHKNEIERVNTELQEKMKELDENRTERAMVQQELDVSNQNLATRILEIKNLEDRIVECKTRHEEEVLDLKSKLDTLANKEDVVENTANDKLILSLRTDNKGLGEEVKRLQGEIQEKEVAHQEEIAFITSELEMRFKEQQHDVNRCHSDELDNLMTRLESLLQQENESKALTESHMQEITSVRSEMEQRIERLARNKEREIEVARRALDDHYKGQQKQLQENLDSKFQEVNELQKMVRTLTRKVESSQERLSEELSRLRHENADLYRKLRETVPRQGNVVSDTNEMTDNLKVENKRLQREIESLKMTMQRHTKSIGESSESTRLLQMLKVMEQLMTEKNELEMKLREEILDMKTRFGEFGGAGEVLSNQSGVSMSPEKVSREGLFDMLQDLRASKRKQEEEIQAHIREIEKMIENIRKRIKSTEFMDLRIQEMLANQLQHLERQRQLLVNRLVKLQEKHDSVEHKLTQQISETSTQSIPGRVDFIKSKLYQNLLEENLRKEKDLLVTKRQQVNDLQTRLSLEKSLMESKVAERQQLKHQLSEKDRQESELSSERNELEKKWIDKLKLKEMELKQEQVHLRSRGHDSVEARISGLISRSSVAPDDKPKARLSTLDYSPITNTEPDVRQSLNRYSLLREVATDQRRSMTSVTTTNTPYDRYQHYVNTGLSSSSQHRPSTRIRTDEFKMLPNVVPKQIRRNSSNFSSDDELDELAPSSNEDSLYWEMDIKTNASDIASISPESTSTLEGMEKDWEKNLEEELRQISAGTLKMLPSGKLKQSTPQQTSALEKPGITRSQSDMIARDFSTSMPSYIRLSERGNTSRIYENYRPDEGFPRSSTALAGDEHEDWLHRNGSINESRIPTVLPTLLNDTKIKETNRREAESRHPEYKDPLKYHVSSIPSADRNRLRFTPTPMNDERDTSTDSPNSSQSEPTRRTVDVRDRSSVFLLNYDDYIDRHQVRSSDKVASLRDLSPSEKYSLC